MSEQPWDQLTSVIVDTGLFIAWFHGDSYALDFFRSAQRVIYYAKVTRTILRTDFEQKGLTKQVRNCLNVGVQLPLKRFLTDDNCP